MSTAIIDQATIPDGATIVAALSGAAYYTYAIARPKRGAQPVAGPIPGVDPRYPVRPISHGGLMALVSTVSLAEFDLATLEQRLQNRAWLEMLAIGHQRVMTALLDHYTLLPLKLCTLYTDEERIQALLETSATPFGAILDRLDGASEWGVKVFCNRATLAAWAEQGAPQLQKLAGSVATASAGARYMLQKRLQRAAQEAAEEIQRSDTQAIALQLAGLARAAQRSRPQPAPIHGHGDEMTLNGAYLVGEAELDTFVAALEALRAQYGPRGFSVELTGPWPAYSFSNGDANNEEV